jgi:hypothetical protein
MREAWEYDKEKWFDKKVIAGILSRIMLGMARLSFGIELVRGICPLLFIFVMTPEPPLA